jgi:hypothetical protein
MQARNLLTSYFRGRCFRGAKLQKIVREIKSGEINPRKLYIQSFNDEEFYPFYPDATFVTTAGATCYLFKID